MMSLRKLRNNIVIRLLSFTLTFFIGLIFFLFLFGYFAESRLRKLKVEIYQRKPNENCLRPKPNPLILVVSVNKDRSIILNNEEFGKWDDTTGLENKLIEVFKNRTISGVLNDDGTQIEKTVMISPNGLTNYEDFIKLVDALNRAGANTIIDPLNQYCRGGGGG